MLRCQTPQHKVTEGVGHKKHDIDKGMSHIECFRLQKLHQRLRAAPSQPTAWQLSWHDYTGIPVTMKTKMKNSKNVWISAFGRTYFEFFTAISDIKTALGLSGFKQLKPIASLFATSGPTRTSPLVILSTKPAHPINKCCKKKQPTNVECQLFFLFPNQER